MTDKQKTPAIKQTPLHARHLSLGARMGAFGGFDMPIQYEGIIREHQATRTAAAIFDTCHMGEFDIEGPAAVADLDRLVSCHVDSLVIGQCRYGFLCNEQGGVIDDLLVYRRGTSAFMLVVNAGTQDNDFDWITAHLSAGTQAHNRSDELAKLDLQGPDAPRMMSILMTEPIDALRYYRFADNRYQGKSVLVSRTGYTGEIGFELYSDAPTALHFWDRCLELGVAPAGLGARDTLRLEMGMPLYGHELNETRNAAASGLMTAIAQDKTFVGSPVVQDNDQPTERLVGFVLEGRRAAREGDSLVTEAGDPAGTITSGSFAPSLGHAIALAYVGKAHVAEGTRLVAGRARQDLRGRVSALPFYRESTARKDMREFLKEGHV